MNFIIWRIFKQILILHSTSTDSGNQSIVNDGERIIRIFNIQHFNRSDICLKNSKPGFNALFPPEINETSGKVACEISTTYIPISFYFRLNEESGRESRFSRGGIKSSN